MRASALKLALRSIPRALSASATLALLLATAGCLDTTRPLVPTAPTPDAGPSLASLQCTAIVAAARVECGDGTLPGLTLSLSAGPLTFGGQGEYVLIRSANPSYNSGTQQLSFDVTIQNRLADVIGTLDGTTADPAGVRLVLAADPQVTGGSGVVTPLNATGTATFTAPGQAYWQYAGALAPTVTSAPLQWRFSVPTTVTSFTFQLFVRAAVPEPEGLRRFRPTAGMGALRAVACPTTATCVAVGEEGVILRRGASSWAPEGTGTTRHLSGVACAAVTDCVAVGDGGTILRWTGAAWAAQPSGTTNDLAGVACPSAAHCIAVGAGGTLLRWDGTAWAPQASGTTNTLRAVTCVAASDCVAVGAGGVLRRWDGSAWTAQTSGTTSDLVSVACPSASDCTAVSTTGVQAVWDGTAWSTQTVQNMTSYDAIACDGSTACIALGVGTATYCLLGGNCPNTPVRRLLRRSGPPAAWSAEVNTAAIPAECAASNNWGVGCLQLGIISPTAACADAQTCGPLTAVTCAAAGVCVAVGSTGTIARWSSGAWTEEASGFFAEISDISCTSASFCLAISAKPRVAVWNGASWRWLPALRVLDPLSQYMGGDLVGTNDSYRLVGVYCGSPTDCVMMTNVGNPAEFRWDGSVVTRRSRSPLGILCIPTEIINCSPYPFGLWCTGINFCAIGFGWFVNGTWQAPSYDEFGSVPYPFTSMSCRPTTECWAVGGGPEVLHTLVNEPGLGETGWVRYNPPPEQVNRYWEREFLPDGYDGSALHGIACPGTYTLCFAVGANGTILQRSASAADSWYGFWSSLPSPTTRRLWDIHCYSETDCMAVGDEGTVLRWNGTAWRALPPLTTRNLKKVKPVDGTRRVIIGEGGYIRFTDR
jgi:hypothetical protein